MGQNSKVKQWIIMLMVGAVTGLGAYWRFRQQRDRQTQGLYGIPGWWKVLAERHGEAKAKMLLEAVEERFIALLDTCAIPPNRALRSHLLQNILPGLALYQVILVEYGGDREAALAEIDTVFRAWTVERFKGKTAAISAIPIPFWLFKIAAGMQMRSFPAEGWEITYIENSGTRLAFNMTRCFYLNTLTALGAPELTAAFCKTDEVMAEAFPVTVRFERDYTLGRGDPVCDFQYCYRDPAYPTVTDGQANLKLTWGPLLAITGALVSLGLLASWLLARRRQ